MGVRDRVAAEPVGDVRAVLGEGPYWRPDDETLLWVDIEQGLLHSTKVQSGETTSAEVGEVSAVFPVLGGGIMTASGNKLVWHVGMPEKGGAGRTVAGVPARAGGRFNDGGIDPAGRIWIGSMHKGETDAVGELYRLDGDVLVPVLKGVTVSNGLAWSPDGSRMYYTDSPTRRIDAFDYDSATGDAFRRRVFADLRGADGFPDGLTVDADGCVWVAMWGGAALRRFAPTGRPDAMVPIPVARPTSCAFGGPDLSELYVTTATSGLSDSARRAQLLAGHLLRLRPGPFGLPSASAEAVLSIPTPPSS